MKRLEKVWKKFSQAQKLLGLFSYMNLSQARFQRRLSRALTANLVLFNVLYVWNFFGAREILLRLQLGMEYMSVFNLSLFYFALLLTNRAHEQCLNWCEGLHKKAQGKPRLEQCFETCAEEATRVIGRVGTAAPFFIVGMVLVQTAFQSFLMGRLEPLFPVYFPFFPRERLANRVLNSLIQWGAVNAMLYPVLVSVCVVFLTVKYAIADIEVLKLVLENERGPRIESLKMAVKIQSDLIRQLRALTTTTRYSWLSFEISCYGLLLLIWVIVVFQPHLWLLACAAAGEFLLYFLICWINEKLVTAFEELWEFLYSLNWTDWTLEERRVLFLIATVSREPRTLTAGGLHVISYENFLIILKRTYSYSVLITKTVRKE